MFKLVEINAILGAQTILRWTFVKGYARMSSSVWGIPDMPDIVFGEQWMLRTGLCSKKNWGLGFGFDLCCVVWYTLVNVYVDLLVFTRIAGTS